MNIKIVHTYVMQNIQYHGNLLLSMLVCATPYWPPGRILSLWLCAACHAAAYFCQRKFPLFLVSEIKSTKKNCVPKNASWQVAKKEEDKRVVQRPIVSLHLSEQKVTKFLPRVPLAWQSWQIKQFQGQIKEQQKRLWQLFVNYCKQAPMGSMASLLVCSLCHPVVF